MRSLLGYIAMRGFDYGFWRGMLFFVEGAVLTDKKKKTDSVVVGLL